MRTIAVVQAKGGVGKSTISVHLATGLAALGQTTLLVDLDPACASSRHLGVTPAPSRPDLWAVLAGRAEPHEALEPVEGMDHLGVLTAPPDVTLSSGVGWGPFRLRVALASLKRRDVRWVVVDTAPGGARATQRALSAADEALVIAEPGWLGESMIDEQLRQIDQLRISFNPSLQVLGVVPNRVPATADGLETLSRLHERYGELILPAVRESGSVAAAAAAGLPVTRCDPESDGARDVSVLVGAVLDRLDDGADDDPPQRRWRSCQRMFHTSQKPHPAANRKQIIAKPG
jgi:chromosome partitioning protein